jgi:hypothetical protein
MRNKRQQIQKNPMKKFNQSFGVMALARGRRALLAGLTAVAVVAAFSSSVVSRAQANESGKGHEESFCRQQDNDLDEVADLDQLLADFHGALSYGGDITAMMALWTGDSTLTFNGVAHAGKPAIQTFFTTGGYFLNDWISLAPEFKTQINVRGKTASAVTQCVAIDLSVSPPVVKSVIQVNATMEKRDGVWYFTSMNNTSPASL